MYATFMLSYTVVCVCVCMLTRVCTVLVHKFMNQVTAPEGRGGEGRGGEDLEGRGGEGRGGEGRRGKGHKPPHLCEPDPRCALPTEDCSP